MNGSIFVAELGQKTFRLPPPKWGSNRSFLRGLPSIMYKGGNVHNPKKEILLAPGGVSAGTGTRYVLGPYEAPTSGTGW